MSRAMCFVALLASVFFVAPVSGQDDLAARVDAEAARIQADPPVHERPEPWNVPLMEFENELQPLRAAQIDERIQVWLDILQDQVRRRNRLQIAAQQAEDDDLRKALLARSAEHQEIVGKIVQRVRAAMLELQRRGGDISEYERYVANVTGTKLNLTDPRVLMAQAMTWIKSPSGGIAVGLKILAFLAMLFAFWIVSRIAAMAVRAAVGRIDEASALLRDFLVGGVRRTVMLVGLVVAVSALGVNINPLIAAIGAAGLVIGLALQGTLSNFASGILILIYKPFDVGDAISAAGVTGKVEAMNLVRTSILTFDNQIHYVPNNEIWNSVITNITGRDTRRVDMVFGIGYGDDAARAHAVIEEVIKAHPKVLPEPAPTIKLHELADSSVNFIARPWARTGDYWDVYWDVTKTIKERFDAEGIGIPYPQRDLHLPEPVQVVVTNG